MTRESNSGADSRGFFEWPTQKRRHRAWIMLPLIACCAAAALIAFRGNDTADLSLERAIAALRQPLTDNQRELAAAAVRRRMVEAVRELCDLSQRPGAAGREAAAALQHLRTELCR